MSEKARILDQLRDIFPQKNDHSLSKCISKVEETVGSNPETILYGCVDILADKSVVNDTSLKTSRSLQDDVVDPERDSLKTEFGDVVSAINRERKMKHSYEMNHTPSILNTTTPSPAPLSQNTVKTVADPRRYLPFTDQDKQLKTLYGIFPDVEEDYIQSLFMKWYGSHPSEAIERTCNEILSKRHHPKKIPSLTTASTMGLPNVLASEPCEPQTQYKLKLLKEEFRLIRVRHIKKALSKFGGDYERSRRYLQEQHRVSMISSGTATSTSTSAALNTSPQLASSVDRVDLTCSKENLGFDTPPKIQLLNHKRPLAQEGDRMSDKPPKKKVRLFDFVCLFVCLFVLET